MPSLTSCYFCGDAVGASLDEYDLPEDAAPDDQVTVTLCAGCKGKLTTLFEQIDSAGVATDAPADDSRTADPVVDADPDVSVEPTIDEDPDLDPVAGDQEPIFADDVNAVLDGDLPEDGEAEPPFATGDEGVESSEASSTAESETDADPATSGASDEAVEETPPVDSASDERSSDSEPEADSEPESVDAADEADAESGAAEAAAADTGDRSDAGNRDAPPVEGNAGGTGATSSTATAESSGSSTDGPLADVSARTYNRVVRLLQNREFPVDRADFEALATSAYELDHGECSAALDGAIEKGLLEERDGELHRPQ